MNLAGETCEKEKQKHSKAGALECFEQHSGDVSLFPDYLEVGHGSPHFCTIEGKKADVNNDWCPYIFFGPHRGKYRHPHIAFSAVEVYLANKVMPDLCKTTWDDSKYPAEVDTTVAFPDMEGGFADVNGLEAPEQPTLKDGTFIWPGPEGAKKKPVIGFFATNLHIIEGYEGVESIEVSTNGKVSTNGDHDHDHTVDESSEAMKTEAKLLVTSLLLAASLFSV